LSLNVNEVVFLIHYIFVNLRDVGDHEIEQNNSQNELVKEPHEVKDINDQFGRNGLFAICFPMICSWVFNVTQDTVLPGNNEISNNIINSFCIVSSFHITPQHVELIIEEECPGNEDRHKRNNLKHNLGNQLSLKSKIIKNLNDVKVL